MRPKAVKPPEIDIQKAPIMVEDLYYPARAIGLVRKDVKKWRWQLNTVLPIALEHVTDFSLAVDGGSFVGAWSREMLKHFDAVYAFEVLEQNRICAGMNAPGVATYAVGLADKSGPVEMGVKDGLFATTQRVAKKRNSYHCVALDSFHVEHCGLIKLDLDGTDLAALKGMKDTIERCSPVMIVEHKLDRIAIPEHMKGLGYHSIYQDKRDNIWIR